MNVHHLDNKLSLKIPQDIEKTVLHVDVISIDPQEVMSSLLCAP